MIWLWKDGSLIASLENPPEKGLVTAGDTVVHLRVNDRIDDLLRQQKDLEKQIRECDAYQKKSSIDPAKAVLAGTGLGSVAMIFCGAPFVPGGVITSFYPGCGVLLAGLITSGILIK